MDLDDQWDILFGFLPSLPLLLGVLAGVVIVRAAVQAVSAGGDAARHHSCHVRTYRRIGNPAAASDSGLIGVRLVCQGGGDSYKPLAAQEIRLCATDVQ